MNETLIIFSRYPEPGKTKTRMIPALGAEGAADLQRQMTEHTLRTAIGLTSSRKVAIEVHFAGGDELLMQQWLGRDIEYIAQAAGDLGVKMRSAFDGAFKRGSQRVVIIGIDCPDIDRQILTQAFNSLSDKPNGQGFQPRAPLEREAELPQSPKETMARAASQRDLVLGVAEDGGYYLIGLNHLVPELFEDITWGTEKVLAQTKNTAEQLNLEVEYLTTLADVDRPEDLKIWQRHIQK